MRKKFACVLALIALALMVLASSETTVKAMLEGICFEPIPSWTVPLQKIIFSVASGLFSGVLIWLFLVYFPYCQKRRAAKASTKMRYRLFRENVAGIFLDAADEGWEPDLIEQLTDPSDFREYFNEVGADGQMRRIEAVQTALSGNRDILDRLITELHLLAEEFRLALYTLDSADSDLLDRYKQFIAAHHNLSYSGNVTTDLLDHHSKLVFQNVYSVMASWSFVKGARGTDIVTEMIEKL